MSFQHTLGDTVAIEISTHSDTGANANADSTPTLTIYQNESAMGSYTGVSMTNYGTGLYKYTLALSTGNTFAAGDRISFLVTVVMGGVTQTFVAKQLNIVSYGVDDILSQTCAELTSITSASDTVAKILALLHMWVRNANTATDTSRTLKNNAGTTIATATTSDDGTTYNQGKLT